MRGSEQAGMRGSVKGGLAWLAGLTALREAGQFGLMLVMTRLLARQDYGQFALTMAILTFVNVFSFRSFLEHTLQLRGEEEADYDMHFTIGAAFQAMLTVAVNAAALVLARVPRYAAVAPLLHAMSALFFLEWMGELRLRMLERRLDWARLRVLQGAGFLLYAVSALTLALAGGGVWALSLPALAVNLPAIADLWLIERWRPHWRFSRERFAPAWRYGCSRIASGLAQTGRPLMENGALSQAVGFATLGLFSRAAGLAQIACAKIPTLLTAALFPILTRIEPGSERYRRAAGLVLCSVAWPVAPAVALLGLLPETVVEWLYGSRWAEVGGYLPLAVVAAGLAALAQTASTLLLAGAQTRKCLGGDLLTMAGTVASLFFLLPHGALTYLAGVAAVNALWLAYTLYWLVRTGSLGAAGVAEALAIPVAAVAGALAAKTWMPAPAAAAAFVILYAAALRLLSAGPLNEVLHFCPGSGPLRRLLWLPA